MQPIGGGDAEVKLLHFYSCSMPVSDLDAVTRIRLSRDCQAGRSGQGRLWASWGVGLLARIRISGVHGCGTALGKAQSESLS